MSVGNSFSVSSFCGNLLLDSLSNHVECIDNKIALFSTVALLDFFFLTATESYDLLMIDTVGLHFALIKQAQHYIFIHNTYVAQISDLFFFT